MTVAWDSTGGGNRTTGASVTSLSTSWSHTVSTTGDNTCIVVGLNTSGSNMLTGNGISCAVTYGSIPMRQMHFNTYAGGGSAGIYVLWNPPSGAQTVTVTVARANPANGGTATFTAVAGNSVAYTGVGSINWGVDTGTSNSPATGVTVTSDSSSMTFSVISNGAALSSPNHTSRYSAGSSVTGIADYISIQDAAGASTVTFTNAGTSTTPNCQAVSLSPTGRSYYLSTSGSDGNTGLDSAHPWQTPFMFSGDSAWGPGSNLFLKGGDTFTSCYLQPVCQGTAANPITITSYGTGKPTLTNTDWTMYLLNADYVNISNLTAVGTGAALTDGYSWGIGLDAEDGVYHSNITVSNCEAYGFNSGIRFAAGGATMGYSNVTISNCSAHDNAVDGLDVYGGLSGSTYSHNNLTVSNCQFYNNAGDSGNTTGVTGYGISLNQASSVTIQNCTAYNNGTNNSYTGAGPAGFATWQTNNVTFTNCLAYNNHDKQNKDGSGFSLMYGTIIQYCLAYGNDNMGIQFNIDGSGVTGATVRYNVCWGNGQVLPNDELGFWSPNGTNAINVYNNTLAATTTVTNMSCIGYASATATGMKFYNNILYTANVSGANFVYVDDVPSTSKILFAGNLYYAAGTWNVFWNGAGTIYNSLTAWRTATGQEILNSVNTGTQSDPQLASPGTSPSTTDPTAIGSTVDSMKIQGGSPAYQTGIDYTTLGLPFVALEAIGVGVASTSGTATSASWTHTSNGLNAAVVVAVSVGLYTGGAYTAYTRSATYGGQAMTSIGVIDSGGGASAPDNNSGFVELYYLANPPTGMQTVVVNAHVTSGGGAPATITANSVSFTNVSGYSAATPTQAKIAASDSITISSAPGSVVLAAGATGDGVVNITQTQIWTGGTSGANSAGFLAIGTAAGASSVTFTTTTTAGTDDFGMVGISLTPATTTALDYWGNAVNTAGPSIGAHVPNPFFGFFG